MDTKPYSLQSPEAIAKEYSGNKMKIAQAAQLGLLDPTAAVLAGMFIDRMRGAQQQEQAPQRTVAQQVLAPTPQAPAGAGLGATPQAAQLAAAYPQEGAPPPIPGPTIPTQEPVMAADGGLMSLPVDDAMFEPAYKEGGIVAFAAGSQEPIQGSAVSQEEADRAAALNTLRKLKAAGMDVLSLPGRGVLGALETGVTRPLRALGVPIPYLPSSVYGGDVSSITPYSDALMREQGQAAQPTLPTPTIKPDIKVADTAVAAPTEKGAAPSGLGSLALGVPAAPKVGSTQEFVRPLIETYMKEAEARDKRFIESTQQNRLEGKAFEGYEKQLQKDAEAAGMEKEDAKNMALFKAGLAMMAGTSANALENIGKGALTGVADYQEAFKNLKKSESERVKALALIEQARRAEAQGDVKRADEARAQAYHTENARHMFGTKAMMEATGKDQDRAFDLWKTQFAGGLQLQAANIAASARTAGATDIDPYKLANLRLRVQESIDPLKVEKTVLNSLNMTEVPKPGDKLYTDYQERLKKAYDAEVNQKLNFALGIAQEDANPYPGFTRAPAGTK